MSDIEKHEGKCEVEYDPRCVNGDWRSSMHDSLATRTQSLTSTRVGGGETDNPHEFPDGGFRAHLTVFGAFIALFCTFGQMNAFGTFQKSIATLEPLYHILDWFRPALGVLLFG